MLPSRLSQILVIVTLLCVPMHAASVVAGESETTSIGVITPLSGHMAIIGSALKNGVELARAERPEHFSKVQILFEDDQFDPKLSLTAYHKLRDVTHARIIFGFGDTLGLTLGPFADRDGVLLVNFNFEASPAVGRKNVVRSMNHTQQYMSALADYLMAQGHGSYQIIQAESPFFNAMANGFREAASSHGTAAGPASFNPDETDFRSTILKLKASAPGPIGLFLAPNQILSFLKQAKELHLQRNFFGTDLFETAAGMASDSELLEGCLYPDNEASASFRNRYRERYGDDAQLTFAASAYELALLIGEQLSSGVKNDPQSLLAAMATIRDREGVLGLFSFVDDPKSGKFFEFPVYVKHIEEGVGKPVGDRASGGWKKGLHE